MDHVFCIHVKAHGHIYWTIRYYLCASMDTAKPSLALLAANRQLYELRDKLQCTRPTAEVPIAVCQAGESSVQDSSLRIAVPDSTKEQIITLPEHLGWGSAALTSVLRKAGQSQQSEFIPDSIQDKPQLSHQESAAPPISKSVNEIITTPQTTSVKLFPDMALGMLRQEQVSAGRIWLLLRHIDTQGSGWVSTAVARELLTRKDSALRVCGWRRLRQILAQGEGMFWQRDQTRIWLRGAAKVASVLDVARLSARPVALPLKALLGSIGTVRAHFYASFHSGRRANMPISRETLSEISNTSAAAQRLYERETGITSQRNIAIGERYTAENVQKRAWTNGRALFDFIDHHGRQGPEKRHYIAWHLPNSYQGCHQHSPKGRMKKINRQIDLVNRRAQGNDLQDRLFHADGAGAAKAHNRRPALDGYWYSETDRPKRRSLWYVLPGQRM